MSGRAPPADTSVHLVCLGVVFVVAAAVFVGGGGGGATAASHVIRPNSRLEMVFLSSQCCVTLENHNYHAFSPAKVCFTSGVESSYM